MKLIMLTLACIAVTSCRQNSPSPSSAAIELPPPPAATRPLEQSDASQQIKQPAPKRIRVRAVFVQIIDEENALVILNPGGFERLVWLTGMPTTGSADGDYISLLYQDELGYLGTKRYESAAGQRTVQHMQYNGVWRRVAGQP